MDLPSNLERVGKCRLLNTGEFSRAYDLQLLRAGELADIELTDLD